MKKFLKTYAVFGLIEWVVEITASKKLLLINFSGGAINGYGITPATYRTANPIIQAAIENSKYFKENRITLYKEVLLADEKPIEHKTVTTQEVEEGTATIELTKVEVSDFPAAQDYLVENYGVVRSKIRSKVATIAFAKEKGIEFIGL